jgi:hypothetical protein
VHLQYASGKVRESKTFAFSLKMCESADQKRNAAIREMISGRAARLRAQCFGSTSLSNRSSHVSEYVQRETLMVPTRYSVPLCAVVENVRASRPGAHRRHPRDAC